MFYFVCPIEFLGPTSRVAYIDENAPAGNIDDGFIFLAYSSMPSILKILLGVIKLE